MDKKSIIGKIFYLKNMKKEFPSVIRVIGIDKYTDILKCYNLLGNNFLYSKELITITETELLDNYVAISPHGVFKISLYTNSKSRMNVVVTISPYIRNYLEDNVFYKMHRFNITMIDMVKQLDYVDRVYESYNIMDIQKEYIVNTTTNSLDIKEGSRILGDNIKHIDSMYIYFYYHDTMDFIRSIKDYIGLSKYDNILSSIIHYKEERDKENIILNRLDKNRFFSELLLNEDYLLPETLNIRYIDSKEICSLKSDGIIYYIHELSKGLINENDKTLNEILKTLFNYEYHIESTIINIRYEDIDLKTLDGRLFNPIDESFTDIVEKFKGFNVMMFVLKDTIPMILIFKELSLEYRIDNEIGMNKLEIGQFMKNAGL